MQNGNLPYAPSLVLRGDRIGVDLDHTAPCSKTSICDRSRAKHLASEHGALSPQPSPNRSLKTRADQAPHRDPKSPIANPGATGPGQFAWGVTAGPPGRRYALAGDYAGLGAGFACGPGLSANALGGNGNSISLQPLSLGPSTGLNLSAGVGSLSLQPVVAEPPRRYRSPSVRNSTKRK
jgi:Protein of unknown function (DUF992)